MNAIDLINIIAIIIGYILIAVLLLIYSLYIRVKINHRLTEDDKRNKAWLLRYYNKLKYKDFCKEAHYCCTCKEYHLPIDDCEINFFND